MIRPAVNFVAGDCCAGPGLTRVMGSAACVTGIIVMPPVPAPAEACVTGIITARIEGSSACVTGIVQDAPKFAITIQRPANVPSSMGNPVTHEEISF